MPENHQYEVLWKRISEVLKDTMSPITYNT